MTDPIRMWPDPLNPPNIETGDLVRIEWWNDGRIHHLVMHAIASDVETSGERTTFGLILEPGSEESSA